MHLLIKQHKVTLHAWYNHREWQTTSHKCHEKDICELIHCYFLARCAPFEVFIMFFLFTSATTVITAIIIKQLIKRLNFLIFKKQRNASLQLRSFYQKKNADGRNTNRRRNDNYNFTVATFLLSCGYFEYETIDFFTAYKLNDPDGVTNDYKF